MAETVRRIVVFNVWTGYDGSYDKTAAYDDWECCVRDLKAALDAGRAVLIERDETTLEEYEADGDEFQDDVNPLV